ncbi:multivesicular body subunit 12Bb [Thalassophryne amazonica]|uniref:multivesicular body subunit 12Bb n=1 Tax=Thalassophryne amazonica TaxID=390379 RepID=UPI0014724FF9|nr:multivesicular body subunit 12Bb [Thalassophryne amazonica]
MSEVLDQSTLPAEPITAVGIVASLTKAPEGFHVVAQTTDGCDADLWKDGLFKSKVTRYLCFSRKNGPDVVADMKVIDIKDKVPEGFTPVNQTMDMLEIAMRKRRLCLKISPREATQTAVYDIQIIAKTKYHLVNYICIGEVNNMGIWYRMGDVVQPGCSPGQINTAANDKQPIPASVVEKEAWHRRRWEYASLKYAALPCGAEF